MEMSKLQLSLHLYLLHQFVLQYLRSHLVRCKLYPLEMKSGSQKCNSWNVQECEYVSSLATKKSLKINHHFDCHSKCLIYLMLRTVCGKQYVGSATERFRFWWNNYKDNQRQAEKGEDHTQKYFHEHFLNHDHNGLINDIEFLFIDKTDPSDPKAYFRRCAVLRRARTFSYSTAQIDV